MRLRMELMTEPSAVMRWAREQVQGVRGDENIARIVALAYLKGAQDALHAGAETLKGTRGTI